MTGSLKQVDAETTTGCWVTGRGSVATTQTEPFESSERNKLCSSQRRQTRHVIVDDRDFIDVFTELCHWRHVVNADVMLVWFSDEVYDAVLVLVVNDAQTHLTLTLLGQRRLVRHFKRGRLTNVQNGRSNSRLSVCCKAHPHVNFGTVGPRPTFLTSGGTYQSSAVADEGRHNSVRLFATCSTVMVQFIS